MYNCAMNKYHFKNILGEDLVFDVHDSITEKGLEQYSKTEDSITYIEEFGTFFNELFGGFGDKKITLLDIGANGGVFSIYCAPLCEKIYAIEPSAILCKAIKDFSKGLDNIVVCNNAISSKQGFITFYFFPDCTGQSTIHNRVKANKVDSIPLTVNSHTILSFIEKHKIEHVDICKVDIEGEEVNLFFDEDIEKLSPYVTKFWIEAHHTVHINGKNMQENFIELTRRFRKKGFDIYEDLNHYGFIATKK